MTDETNNPIDPEDMPEDLPEGALQLDPDELHKELQACIASLDSEVTSGPDARDLHDFIQDKLSPLLLKLSETNIGVVEFLHQHDERLADIEEDRGSQLMPADAEILIGWIKEASKLLSLTKTPKGKQLVEEGRELIGIIEGMTLSLEDEANQDGAPAH